MFGLWWGVAWAATGVAPRDYAQQHIVIVGTSADPRALEAVEREVAAWAPVRLWSSDFEGLKPCWHLVVAGRFPQREAAEARAAELRARGAEAYVRTTGAYLGAAAERAACPAAGSDAWFFDDGGLGLGPHPGPEGGWPDRTDRIRLDAVEVAGLRRGEWLRVGDRLCTVAGFELRRVCTDRAEAVALLSPDGCGTGGLARPLASPEPEIYGKVPIPGAARDALEPAIADARAVLAAEHGPPQRTERIEAAWSGGAGLVVSLRVEDRWESPAFECGGVLVEESAALALFPGGDLATEPIVLQAGGEGAVGIVDLERDGAPELWTAGEDGSQALWSGSRLLERLERVFCTCGC